MYQPYFEDIISIDNLLEAWKEFIRGKRNKRDVQEFSLNLMDRIFVLHEDLKSGRRGRILIEFYSPEELNSILDKILKS